MSSFESLPNEILLEIFRYFDLTELVKSFDRLNSRFNELLFNKIHRYSLNFSSQSPKEFDEFCVQYLPSIEHQVVSCRFSDDIQSRTLSRFILQSKFHLERFVNLKSLLIDEIYSYDLLNEVTDQLNKLRFITHLRLKLSNHNDVEQKDSLFITNIWSLKTLRNVHLTLICRSTYLLFDMSTASESIRSLHLEGFIIYCSTVNFIMKFTPNLEHLALDNFNSLNDRIETSKYSSLISVKINLSNSIENVKKFFSRTPNLRSLDVGFERIPLDGRKLEELFRHYLPQLNRLRLRLIVEFSPSGDFDEQVETILETFRSDFWLIEHQWFVRCHWCVTNFQRTGLLHTIPFPLESFIFFDGSQSKSTEIHQENPFDHVKNVIHIDRQKSVSECLIDWPFPFRSLQRLTITLPVFDHLWSNFPTFDQLVFLDVTLNQRFALHQLQTLIDRSPRLHSLKFSSMEKNSRADLQLTSSSIRRLQLGDNALFPHDYFSDDECLKFSSTPLVSQCEVLIIDIRTQFGLIELIKQMTKLRALSVKSCDDLMKTFPKEISASIIVESINRNVLEYDRIDLILSRR